MSSASPSEPMLANVNDATRRYFRAYLRVSPVCNAIYRSVEAARMAEAPLGAPMLDLGCGFGEFGSVFLTQGAEVGVDINRGDLASAAKKGIYQSLVQGDGRRLPFGGGSFQSVMSVSTLEHVPAVGGIVRDVFRVLRPGGVFAFTVPTDKLSDMLAVPKLLTAIRARPLAKAYARKLNSSLDHVNLWSAAKWRRELEDAGFEVERCEEIVSPAATAAWDLCLAPAMPERFYRIVTGRRPVKPAAMVNVLERIFGRFALRESGEGSNLFVVARKPDR